MSCKSSGQINDDIRLALDTDGLTMSLTSTSVSTAGDVYVKCKGGFGQSMRPQGEGGTGSAFSGECLTNSRELVVPISETAFARFAPPGVSVSGETKTTMTLVCPGF
jgi:hypothetical protein